MKPQLSKPPRVKRGHKKPSFKPNADEMERRITAVELLLSRGARKTQIHDAMRKQFDLHFRTADEYTVRARARILQRLGKSRDAHRSESLAFYESMIQDATARPSDKLRARQLVDELLGLAEPKRQEISGPAGGPVAIEDKTQPKLHPDVLRRIISEATPHESPKNTNGTRAATGG